MKKTLSILAILVCALAIIGGVYFFYVTKQNTKPTEIRTSTLPNGESASGDLGTVLYTSDGNSIHVRNFTTDQSVKSDTANQGYYMMGYQPGSDGGTQDLPYLIEYISDTNYFGISIQKEPLGEIRKEAEQYLKKTLGLSEAEMCSLRYQLSVPDSVNSHYAGQNLEFSFCPGSIKLP